MEVVQKLITNQNNYQVGRPGWTGHPFVVLHHTAGATPNGLYDEFQNNTRQTSCHFLVKHDGTIEQYVDLNNTAYHCGNLWANHQSVGIEHEDGGNDTFTDAQYESSAWLIVNYINPWFSGAIAYNSAGLTPHKQWSNTACPGALDIGRIMRRCNELAHPPVDPCEDVKKENEKLKKQLSDIQLILNS